MILGIIDKVRISFIQLSAFSANWRRLKLTDADLRLLEALVQRDPAAAPVISGTGGLRKMRFAAVKSSAGKRGSARVCYVYFMQYGLVYLMAVYAKTEKENLTSAERAAYKEVIEQFDRYLREWFEKGWTP